MTRNPTKKDKDWEFKRSNCVKNKKSELRKNRPEIAPENLDCTDTEPLSPDSGPGPSDCSLQPTTGGPAGCHNDLLEATNNRAGSYEGSLFGDGILNAVVLSAVICLQTCTRRNWELEGGAAAGNRESRVGLAPTGDHEHPRTQREPG